MTSQISEFIPITDRRQDAASILRAIQAGEEPIVIMQRSRATAVLLSVDTYERLVYEREVLGILAKGESDIQPAKGVSIESLPADIDGLRAKDIS